MSTPVTKTRVVFEPELIRKKLVFVKKFSPQDEKPRSAAELRPSITLDTLYRHNRSDFP
jgi:hypothetical protein